MRALLLLLVACTASPTLAVDQDPSLRPPLGVGLSDSYRVTDIACDEPPVGACDELNPATLVVTVAAPIASVSVDTTSGNFTLTGLVAGDSSLAVSADRQTVHYSFTVAAVASTSLVVTRHSMGGSLPDMMSPVQVFTGETIPVAQTSVGPDQAPRSGKAPLQLAAGATGVTAIADATYDTGQRTGAATIAAPLGTLALDVVDTTAMVDFTISGMSGSTIALNADAIDEQFLFLQAINAAGRAIVGRGPEPTFSTADPSIARVGETSTSYDNVRYLGFVAPTPGTTTLDLTWGSIRKHISVVVR